MERKYPNLGKNILKIFLKIMQILIIICCILFILVVFMQRITNSNGSLGGYRIFTVITGSMLPRYEIGDVVICKEVDLSTIKQGDAIVYKGRNGELAGKIIMHEVVNVNVDNNGRITFHTKGTNNEEEDPEVKGEQVYGLVVIKSKLLSVLYALATNVYASFVIILILVGNVFFQFKNDKKEMIKRDTGDIIEAEKKDKLEITNDEDSENGEEEEAVNNQIISGIKKEENEEEKEKKNKT